MIITRGLSVVALLSTWFAIAGCNSTGPGSASGTDDSALATASVSGIMMVATGGAQTLSVTFSASDGQTLSHLAVTTGLATLPPGWSGPASFSCTNVSTGSGCVLNLNYAPMAFTHGTLTVAYTYTDNAGAPKSGTVSVDYGATVHDNVVAMAAPSGQVTATAGSGTQNVAVSFTTDDGNPATALTVTSDLAALPAGWSSANSGFSCASVSTANGCQLSLSFAPSTAGSGTLNVAYAYTDDAGTAKTGSLNIGYASTVHDSVVATAAPSGQVTATAGSGTQNVAVSFTTDDGNPATALTVTSDLAALPAGWSSANSGFSCASVSTANGCQLSLSFAPSTAGSGTLNVAYAYTDDAGTAKTGSLNIGYTGTSNDNVVTTASPSAPTEPVDSSATVTVTFTTDDGSTSTGLSITSGLNSLPAGWSSGSGSFACGSLSTGTGCQLTLTYAPTAAVSGTLTLGYAYTNNAGIAKTGNASIGYHTATLYLYVANFSGNTISYCPIQAGGTLGPCGSTGTGLNSPQGLAISGQYAYIANANGSSVSICRLSSNGSLSGCANTHFAWPGSVSASPNGAYLYVSTNGVLDVCTMSPSDGSLSGCTSSGAIDYGHIAFSATGARAYGTFNTYNWQTDTFTTTLADCAVQPDGTLANCAATGANLGSAGQVAGLYGDSLYTLAGSGLDVCPANGDGSIGDCAPTASGPAQGAAFHGNDAYLTIWPSTVELCPINVDGTLGSCSVLSDPTFNQTRGAAVALVTD